MKNKIVGQGLAPAVKKVLSLLLAIVMLFSITAGIDLSAYAAGWSSYAQHIDLDTTYSEEASTLDYTTGDNHSFMGDDYYDSFIFNVPIKGKITINVEAEDYSYFTNTNYYFYKSNDLNNYINGNYEISQKLSSATGMYYGSMDISLPKGTYYLVVEYQSNIVYYGGYEGSYDFSLSYKPSLGKPSNFKVSTRKTTSLKLSWKKVSGASGYQIQQKKSGKWKTIKNTTSNAYTVSKLKAGTSYQFRVRTYKTISGKKYYGSWVTLTTPTKPATVTLSSVKSKKSKQLTVKWKKVTGTGYQIQYSTNKNFSKNKKTVTVSKNSTTSKTISKLKGKKKYYVRVRAYKTVNGTKYCGAWSKTKAVTTKK